MFADLVLEDGGVKGIALVGAIGVLQERGYQFRRVAGTSAQDALFQQGCQAALDFLDGTPGQPAWDWDAYQHTHRPGQAAA